ncbi:hypothetical protein DYB28_009926 [Aphanomyces astaci]|uniref:Uncharacterized protein n=1 Tax=Aphanomyces astaci TaxID=112090 RepID=A0A9X8HG33_APHAT|nr:hypothetical protein DYB28_009926 [Aphanomyces astaci]
MRRQCHTFNDVDWLGFDVDGTLVEYNHSCLDQLSFDKAVDVLISMFPTLNTTPRPTYLYSTHIAQRCVTVDTSRGNFLYVTASGVIHHAVHGHARAVDIASTYPSCRWVHREPPATETHHQNIPSSPEHATSCVDMWTLGDTVFAPLYAWLIDMHDANKIALVTNIDKTQTTYEHLAQLAKQAIGTFYRTQFEVRCDVATVQEEKGAKRLLPHNSYLDKCIREATQTHCTRSLPPHIQMSA